MEHIKGDIIKPHIRAWKEDFRNRINITILKEVVGIRTLFVRELHFVEDTSDIINLTAPLQLCATEAQILMDDLWDCGIRPSEGTGSAGALKAVQNHLSDIRKILYHKMGIKENIEKSSGK